MSVLSSIKKTLSLVLPLTLTFGLSATVWAAQNPKDDLQGHWAEKTMRQWASESLLQGYNDRYSPDQAITRAEFATLINRANKLTEAEKISFSDLESSNWAYEQIAIAAKAGYVKGYKDGTVRPGNPVTREEAAGMVASYLKLDSDGLKGLANFKDAEALPSWSKNPVAALAEAGILAGNAKGEFRPGERLTRAEAVTLLDKARNYKKPAAEYNKAGVYGPETGTETIKGDVIVSAPGVTLRNVTIEGNLTIAAAVGEGDAHFKKVTVKGTTTIQGGGANSVHFEDSVLVRISVDKRDGTVRVVVVGDTTIEYAVIHSPVKLEESSATDSGFKNVELASNLPAGSAVQFTGQFESVTVLSSDVKISLPSGSIQQLSVGAGASNAQVDVGKGATIAELVLDAVAKLLGQGKIDKATINKGASGSSFETRPSTVSGEASGSISAPSAGGGGGSGGTNPGNPGNPNPGNPNPGNPNPSTCTGTTEECRAAGLVDLAVEGFALNRLDSNFFTTSEAGFSPDTFAYSIVTERDMQTTTASITVTKATYGTVSYRVEGRSLNLYGSLTQDAPSIEIPVSPNEDIEVSLTSRSGDGLSTKYYQIFIQYKRTIQEGLKFSSNFYNETLNNYSLQLGSVGGEKLRYDDQVRIYESESDIGNPNKQPLLQCIGGGCGITPDKIAALTGTWFVQIARNGETEPFAQGEYNYDFRPAEVLPNPSVFFAETLTTQGLIDVVSENPFYAAEFRSGFDFKVDKTKLLAALPNAKYYGSITRTMSGTVTALPSGLTYDDLKIGILPDGYSGMFSLGYGSQFYFNGTPSIVHLGSHYTHVATGPNASKQVDDEFRFIGVYDADQRLIGQYIVVVAFDQAHVAAGHQASGNWRPAQP